MRARKVQSTKQRVRDVRRSFALRGKLACLSSRPSSSPLWLPTYFTDDATARPEAEGAGASVCGDSSVELDAVCAVPVNRLTAATRAMLCLSMAASRVHTVAMLGRCCGAAAQHCVMMPVSVEPHRAAICAVSGRWL